MITRPDPFSAAFNFTPRPDRGPVAIIPDDPASINAEESETSDSPRNKWLDPPRADQCPTYQLLRSPRGTCYWGLDFFRPYLLTDENADVVVTDSGLISVLSALGRK